MLRQVGAVHRTARTVTATTIDGYEAAIRGVTELEWALAHAVGFEPLATLAGACADLTRDAAAIQLSTARWFLDL